MIDHSFGNNSTPSGEHSPERCPCGHGASRMITLGDLLTLSDDESTWPDWWELCRDCEERGLI